MITFSFPFKPATTSTSLPKSWPRVICFSSTFWSWFNGGDPQTFGAEEQRIHRQNQRRRRGRQLEMHFGIRAGEELSGRIVHRNFDQQGARCRVDGIGGAHQLALEAASGKLRQGQVGGDARLCGLRVDLGHADIDAKFVRLRDVEQLIAGAAAAAGIDQGADVGIARRDYSGEGSIDFLERLQSPPAASHWLAPTAGRPAWLRSLRRRCQIPAWKPIRFSTGRRSGRL